MKQTFKSTVFNLKLIIEDKPELRKFLKRFRNGDDLEVEIRTPKKDRSLEQNAYYWGVIIKTLGDHFGYEKEEMHEALKWHFLRKHESPLPTVKSTTRLNTKEFVDYIERIQRWASIEHGVYLPDPNEGLNNG